MNYCIHGAAINEYCPSCILDLNIIEAWLGGCRVVDCPDFAALLHDGADTAKLILEQAFSPDYGFPAHYETASSVNRTLHHAWLQVDKDLDFSDCQHDNEDYYSRCSICGEEIPHVCDDDCRSNGCTEKGYSRREGR